MDGSGEGGGQMNVGVNLKSFLSLTLVDMKEYQFSACIFMALDSALNKTFDYIKPIVCYFWYTVIQN